MSDTENPKKTRSSEKKHKPTGFGVPPPEHYFTSETAAAAAKKGAEVRRHHADMKESARIFANLTLKAGSRTSIGKLNNLAESKGANLTLLDATVRMHWVKAMRGDPASTRIIMDLLGVSSLSEISVKTDETESLKKLKKKLADDPALLDRIIADDRDGK